MFKFFLLMLLSTFIYADEDFADFINTLKIQAKEQGISSATADLLDTITLNKRVLELDSRQAEFTLNFTNYLTARVNDRRFFEGKKQFSQNEQLFQKVYAQYGVPKHILIAFWGLESNYSRTTGTFSLLEALTTLSYDKRRREFFTGQLLNALELIDKGIIGASVKGSWAGAIGGVQFMPSNLLAYGVDANNDGKINLWNDAEDMFMSAANFLKHIGWHRGEKWGREVRLPAEFDYSLAHLRTKKSVNEWAQLGIKSADNTPLPASNMLASLVVPMGAEGPKFLVYRNFNAILNWNRSVLYALSVGIMADKFLGIELRAELMQEENLRKEEVRFIQQRLNDLGFNAGPVDGVLGSQTKNAVRNYQQANNLVVDGYVGYKLLQQLRL